MIDIVGQAEIANLASQLFQVRAELDAVEDELCALACYHLGLTTDQFEDGKWPFEDVTTDSYDRSFELKACQADIRFSPEALSSFWSAGFENIWLCHIDGYETGYTKDGNPEGVRIYRGELSR